MKSPTNNPNPQSLVSTQTPAGAVVLDGGRVFWTTIGGNMVASAGTWVADQDGNNVKMLSIPMQPGHASGHHTLAVSSNTLYWTDVIGGQVLKIDANVIMPMSATQVATNQASPFNVAVAGGALFWSAPGNGSANTGAIQKATLPSGAAMPYAQSLTRPFDVASDGNNLYFSLNNMNGAIVRGGLGGGGLRTIATPSFPGCIAVDGSSVYYLATLNGMTMAFKTPK